MNSESANIQSLSGCADSSLVGGKAINLGRLIRAGFTVPDGFVVTTYAYRHAQHLGSDSMPTEMSDQIRAACRSLGAKTFAVRSSATAEDSATASMAGQYETFLDIEGEEDVLDAVLRCWASLDSPRTRAYLQEHRIDPSGVAMAVIVQKLVPAEVAGVLFTASPNGGSRGEMLLEACWGLGESLVSGRVQPDVLRLDRESGRVLAATIADKQVYVPAGAHHQQPVDESLRRRPCLKGRDVDRLWQLGKRAAEYFEAPQDIEWAIHSGEVYLLQSRPITTGREIEAREQILRDARERLNTESAAKRGPWALHNLAETLPHPTPLTWSVMRRFMSASGGFGKMYRMAGFEPSTALDHDGFLELIAGRIYMDAARAPEMFFADFPFAYDVNLLKASPDASQSPPTLPRGSPAARRKAHRNLVAVDARLREIALTLDQTLKEKLFLEVAGYVTRTRSIDLASLTPDWLLELWQEHEKLILEEFAPQLLLPGLICGMALEDLRNFLRQTLWNEDADGLSQLISSGGEPNRTIVADAELYEVGKGSRSMEEWLAGHGHRAAGEFDLGAPRWRERPAAAQEMAERLAAGDGPLDRHRANAQRISTRLTEIRRRLSRGDQREFDRRIDLVRRYVRYREDGKDYLMLGYDLLRDVALEAGRRLEIGEDVFYLTRQELFDSVRVGYAPYQIIADRKIAHQAQAKLVLPRVIDTCDIDSLGEAPKVILAAGGHKAFAVSFGQASGPARILHSPDEAADIGRGYVLVCPSTDPSWTPLFVNAAALVLECGGTLSHGAVVAREMGLPAVVLPDATRIFREGESLRVDGGRGWVGPAELAPEADSSETMKLETSEALPPPQSRKDQRAARIAATLGIGWAIYLLAMFLLPPRVLYEPTVALMDHLLWPIVRGFGKPAAVATIAFGIAIVTLLVQRFATDNARLIEARRRAASIKARARSLPDDSPKRIELLQLIGGVQYRSLLAAMVPIGILLGPMVMPFIWFQKRVDPLTWNAPAGSAVQIIAMAESDFTQPIRIDVPADVTIDSTTPPSRVLPQLRKPLERLLVLYRQPRADANDPWELQAAPDSGRQEMADDLQAYLDAGIPPQGITWLIRPPAGWVGKLPVMVTAAGHAPISVDVVLGDQNPPAPLTVAAPGDSPLKSVRIVYPRASQQPIFWRPVAGIDIGWIGVYILAYLPALVLIKRILRIA